MKNAINQPIRFCFGLIKPAPSLRVSFKTWLESEAIVFVPKLDKPPNSPQVRPIEHFWAFLKIKVYKRGWSAKNKADLQRIKNCAKILPANVCQNVFRNRPTKNSKLC